MTIVSIGKAWEATVAFVKREGTLLFPVAFVFIALPLVAFQQMVPAELKTGQPQFANAQAIVDAMRPLMLAAIPLSLVTMFGGLSLFALAMRPGISVLEALTLGLRRLPVLIGTSLVLAGCAAAAVVVLSILSALAGAMLGQAGVALILSLAFIVLGGGIIWVGLRLLMLNPLILDRPVGPLDALRQAWPLTLGNFWRLAGFVIIFFIVATIAQAALSAVLGVIGGLAGGPTIAALMGDIGAVAVSSVSQVYIVVMLARIYEQLADDGRGVAALFE